MHVPDVQVAPRAQHRGGQSKTVAGAEAEIAHFKALDLDVRDRITAYNGQTLVLDAW